MTTTTQCPFCRYWTDNSKHYCSNSACCLAEGNWNGYLPQLQNPLTGQVANLSEFGKLPKAFAMGFTRIGPVPATPATRPAPPKTPDRVGSVLLRGTPTATYVVVGYRPVLPAAVIIYR